MNSKCGEISGKCPGIYDDWDKVQSQIKDFKGAEYTSKVRGKLLLFIFPWIYRKYRYLSQIQSSKEEAIELFHKKRPDWPKQRIPDFTLHASNRSESKFKPCPLSNLKHQLVLQTPTTGEQRRGEERRRRRRRLLQQPVRQPQKQQPQGRLPHKLCRQRDHTRRKERRGKQALLQRDAKDLGLGGKQLRLWFGTARSSSGARGQAGEDRAAAELAGRPQVRLQAVVQSSSASHKEGNSFIHQGNRIGSLLKTICSPLARPPCTRSAPSP